MQPRQLLDALLHRSLIGDCIATVDALGLVAGELHRDRARDAGALERRGGGLQELAEKLRQSPGRRLRHAQGPQEDRRHAEQVLLDLVELYSRYGQAERA